MPEQRRTFTSELNQLPLLRPFLLTTCQEAWSVSSDDESLNDLAVAVQEAATNVIRHAYSGESGRPIDMTIRLDENLADITLRHEGPAFDPATVDPPAFDGSRFGGFGIYMIQQLVDEVVYDRDTSGRSGVRLLKRRKQD